MKPLNLATAPFRNERLPILLTSLLAVLALGMTLAHGIALSSVLPSQLDKAEAEVGALQATLSQLRSERERLRDLRPSKDDLERWTIVRELVDRRVFRWDTLFSRLGTVVTPGIRLSAIEPVVQDGVVEVRLTAATTPGGTQALLDLVRRIEDQPDFDSAAPESLNDDEKGTVMVVRARYHPSWPQDKQKAAQATPQPSPSPETRS